MKITIVSDTIFPDQVNGVAKMAFRSAAMLRQRGHEVSVVSVRDVPSLPFWGYAGERFAIPHGAGYRQILKSKPDIIHTHTPFTLGWEAVFAARALRVPLVGTHHTFFDHYLKHLHIDAHWTRRLSWRYLVNHYDRYDLVLSPSRTLLAGMQEEGLESEVKFFPNAIDTTLFVPATRESKEDRKRALGIAGTSLVYMGRLSYEKSIDHVLHAFARIQEEHSPSTLLLIGDGPERKKLEALAERLGIRELVRFTGMLHDESLVHALQAADVFITASKSENMPLSVIEALSVGLPVVAVDSLGLPEIVRDGVEGRIVAPDDVAGMSDSVLQLFRDEALRARYASAARERGLHYSEEHNAEALEALYESLLDHERRP